MGNDPNRPGQQPATDPARVPGGGEADRNKPAQDNQTETDEQRREREKREREQK